MTIQSPFEWGWDRLRGGVQAIGSAPREEYWPEAHQRRGVPAIRRIGAADLKAALSRGLDDFRADVVAGLTVAIVALPLSMAIAIASGVTPDRGLYTAIVGGFFVSLLGGSRFQVGGPAGAFIVLVAQTVQNHGVDGVVLATLMAGAFLIVAGFLRLAEAEFVRRGCTNVALQLGRGNDRARVFYRAHGYGERAGYDLLDKMLG